MGTWVEEATGAVVCGSESQVLVLVLPPVASLDSLVLGCGLALESVLSLRTSNLISFMIGRSMVFVGVRMVAARAMPSLEGLICSTTPLWNPLTGDL